MADSSKASLNSATVEGCDLRQCVEGCVRHGFAGISPWRDLVQAAGIGESARMIRDSGLEVTGLCRAGMFTAPTPAGRQAALDDNRRAVDEAVAIGANCLVLVAGGLPEGSKDLADARAQIEDGLGALLDHARPAGMPLAIEPLHPMYAADRASVNTLGQANDLCDRLGDGVGLAVDVYHLWWDPELEAQIRRAGKERILAFHVCDWLVPTRHLLTDRGMMGDGVIDIPKIRSWVEGVGYDGLYEVEIFSELDWWTRDRDEVMATVRSRIESAV
ncbi:sugar phosphate isomerase/epimerase family protein [Microbaculum marinum]|uniref:Sugar phosphate isomerase/epimerase family protein n=1 Tax=Microbaculum marinum TaxID=1764581 RepID=A0AAW9RAY3_9HYPH